MFNDIRQFIESVSRSVTPSPTLCPPPIEESIAAPRFILRKMYVPSSPIEINNDNEIADSPRLSPEGKTNYLTWSYQCHFRPAQFVTIDVKEINNAESEFHSNSSHLKMMP